MAEFEEQLNAIDVMWEMLLTNVSTDLVRRLQGLKLLLTENHMANGTLLDGFLMEQSQTFARILSAVSASLPPFVEEMKRQYDQLLEQRCSYFEQE